jgi:hypothetical protein
MKHLCDLGMYPLHAACHANATLEVIQFLVKQWPHALTEQSNNGMLPLDFAKHLTTEYTPNQVNIDWLKIETASNKSFFVVH